MQNEMIIQFNQLAELIRDAAGMRFNGAGARNEWIQLTSNDEEDGPLDVVLADIDERACQLFITNNGSPNRSNIESFKSITGFRVGPGESDSFGWLTGIIHTPHGMVSFG